MRQGGFTFDPEAEKEEAAPITVQKCTPDKLLAWIEGLGRMPTLAERKREWGGILGPMTAGWELQAQGRFPTF